VFARTAGPLKVALFSPSMTWGGAEKMFKRLAIGFARAGLTVDLVLASANGPNMAGLPPEVRVFDLHCRRLLVSTGPLACYLKNERPDVLLSTQYHANLLAVLARQSAGNLSQLILREANTMSVATSHSGDVRDRVVPSLARIFYPCADAVVAVSEGVAADLINCIGIPAPIVRVIYNPTVDLDIECSMRRPVDHPWLHDNGPPVLLSVGRLCPQKRFDILVRSVSIAAKRRPIRLIILGDGEDRARLECLARELEVDGCVSLPGFVDNPYAYMARSDLFVLSSAWEGLPNTLIEAMACGLPIVSTDCPSGPREILAARGCGTGRFGTLVPVDRPEEMADAILRELALKHNPADSARRAQRFGAARSVRSYVDLMHLAGRR
jgi:glycosyltransferase involved in cell wall biosynthesis